MEAGYRVYGVEPSCYTQKTLGYVRGKGLAHEFKLKDLSLREVVEKACSGYAKMPVVETPDGIWLTDSTRIALALDERHPETRLLPEDPALRIIARILDDWLDEWMVRVAAYWRANDAEMRGFVTRVIARNLMGARHGEPLPEGKEDKVEAVAKQLEPRFAGLGPRWRVTEEHEAEVQDLMCRAFDLLSVHLARHAFLLGGRVSLADYALYGLLAGQLLFEPVPRELIEERWPGLIDYVQRVSEARAGEGQWVDAESLPRSLFAVLRYVGEEFSPYLLANRDAVLSGAAEAVWDEMTMPVRPDTETARQEVAEEMKALPDAEKERLERLVGATDLLTPYKT